METIIVALISAFGIVATTIIQTLASRETKDIKMIMETDKKEIKVELKKIDKKIDTVDIGSLKNFLSRTLGEIDNGEKIDEAVKSRLYEAYDRYTKTYHQNSYIHDKWEKLKKEDKL